jgi:hypothetical protein
MGRVYTIESQDRFFLLDAEDTLPKGPLVLRSLSGARIEVDPAAVAPFEIDEARAKAIVKEEVARFAKTAMGALSGVGSILRAVAQKQAVGPLPPNPREAHVSEALGVTKEQLHTDPDAVMDGLQAVLSGLADTVGDALKDAPEARERTRERLQAFVSTMGQDAPDVGTIETGLEKIREALGDPATEAAVREASRKIEEATARIKTEGEALLRDTDES